MAYSVVQYTGDGVATSFAVPFPFLSRDHIVVTVNGVITAPSWISDGLFQLSPAPPLAAAIIVTRDSSRGVPLVDFQDAQVLTETDLDTATRQNLYVAQEAFDQSDASTIPATVAADAAAAAASATAAANSATAASASANNATTSATNAATSASDAAASALALTQVWHLNAANTVTNAQRATIDPNATFDLSGASLSATFLMTPLASPMNVPAGKTLTTFRTQGTYKLNANSVVAPTNHDIATDAASDILGSAYGYKSKITMNAGGAAYGAYSEIDVTSGVANASVFPMYLKIVGSFATPTVGGALLTLESASPTFIGNGFEVRGTGSPDPTIFYPFHIQNSVIVSGAAFRWDAPAANPSDFLQLFQAGDPNLRFRVDNAGAVRAAAPVYTYGSIDTGNTHYASFGANVIANTVGIDSTKNGTGTTRDFVFSFDGVEKARLKTNGNLVAKLKDTGGAMVHVETFGAVGDGTTDDTAALQTAFNSASVLAFRPGATYKVTDTLYLSHPSFATAVRKIIGNGATLSFSGFARTCSDDLTTTVFGVCGASSTTAGAYDGWQGAIEDLKFTTAQKLVMLGGCGNLFRLSRCSFTSVGTSVKGAILLRNNINTHIADCAIDMRSVCTDTTGTGSFFTTVGGTNIPSSFGVFFHRLLPAQVDTLGRGITDASTSGFNDPYQITHSIIVGGQTGLADGSSDSHAYRLVQGNEFAYCHYGIITNAGGTVADNWFENHKFACLRTVAGGPPWWAGSGVQPLQVLRNSFSPHNGGTALLLDSIPNDSVFSGNNYGDPIAGGTYVNVGASNCGNRAYWLHNTNSNGGTVTGLSATSVDTAFTIVGGTGTEQHASAIAVNAKASVAWSFDGPGVAAPLALANGATVDFPAGGGMLVLKAAETGNTVAYLAGGAAVALLGQTAGAEFVALAANTAPAAGKIGIYFNTASSAYRLHNNVGATRTVAMVTMRAAATN